MTWLKNNYRSAVVMATAVFVGFFSAGTGGGGTTLAGAESAAVALAVSAYIMLYVCGRPVAQSVILRGLTLGIGVFAVGVSALLGVGVPGFVGYGLLAGILSILILEFV